MLDERVPVAVAEADVHVCCQARSQCAHRHTPPLIGPSRQASELYGDLRAGSRLDGFLVSALEPVVP